MATLKVRFLKPFLFADVVGGNFYNISVVEDFNKIEGHLNSDLVEELEALGVVEDLESEE